MPKLTLALALASQQPEGNAKEILQPSSQGCVRFLFSKLTESVVVVLVVFFYFSLFCFPLYRV